MQIRVDGVSLHYEVRGRGAPVLFLHGFPLSGEVWTPVVERLGDGYRAIVPDLRGFGGSEAGPRADMATLAEDLARLLDHLEEEGPVTLVGLSMGGYVAFEFCRRYPERVHALVLVDTRAQPDTEEAARGRLETAERVLAEGSGVVADSMVERLFAPGTDQGVRERWRAIMAESAPEGVAAALRGMAERPDSVATLRSLRRPVMIVVGEDDAITPPAEAERMQEIAHGSRLHVIPGAGHMTPVEQPARFAALLTDFLRETGAVSGGGG